MQVSGPVDKPWPDDDRRKAGLPGVAHRLLTVCLSCLVDVGRTKRRALVGRSLAGNTQHTGRAAVDKPPDGGLPAAGLEQQPGALDVRLPVFIRRHARDQQPAGKVIDDPHAIEGGL